MLAGIASPGTAGAVRRHRSRVGSVAHPERGGRHPGHGGWPAGIRYVGYAEFAAAARFVRKRLRAVVGAQVHVDVLGRALRSAATVEECWIAIERAGRALGYCRIEARLSGARFSSSRGEGREAWQMRVNLTGGDYVNVSQFRGAPEQPCVLAAFVDVLGEAL